MASEPQGTSSPGAGAGDIVPLHDRLQQLHLFRLVVTAALVLATVVGRVTAESTTLVVAGLAAYAVVTTVVLAAWRRGLAAGLPVFGALLIADGLVLMAVRLLVEDPSGTVRMLPTLHIVVVTLLGSYATGWKLAVWHTLLYFTGAEAVVAGLLPGLGLSQAPVTAPLIVLWAAMFITSAGSQLNERELRRQRHDLDGLANFSADLQVAHDPQDVADRLARAMLDVAEVEELLLLDVADGRVLVGPDAGREVTISTSDVLVQAVREASPQLVQRLDERSDGWLQRLFPTAENLMVLPGLVEGEAILLAVIPNARPAGSRVQRRVLGSLERTFSFGAMAYLNVVLREDLTARAATDGLTGVANRAAFDQRLAVEVERAARTNDVVSLVMLDVDHFKAFNDVHGHLAGDDALRAVASALTEASRAYDLVARYGGEEFAVILSGTTSEQAGLAAERLRRGVEEVTDIAGPVTASVGVSSTEVHADAGGLLGAADAALYAAKRAGRNCVVIEGPDVDVRTERSPVGNSA